MASGDQRRRTGSGSSLEALRDDVLYKHMFTLLYFTLAYLKTPSLLVFKSHIKPFH